MDKFEETAGKEIEELQGFCPECGTEHLIKKMKRTRTMTVKNKVITYEEEYYYCPITGDEWQVGKMIDENLDRAKRELYK
jgi:uncharacterized protein with PIN domain